MVTPSGLAGPGFGPPLPLPPLPSGGAPVEALGILESPSLQTGDPKLHGSGSYGAIPKTRKAGLCPSAGKTCPQRKKGAFAREEGAYDVPRKLSLDHCPDFHFVPVRVKPEEEGEEERGRGESGRVKFVDGEERGRGNPYENVMVDK